MDSNSFTPRLFLAASVAIALTGMTTITPATEQEKKAHKGAASARLPVRDLVVTPNDMISQVAFSPDSKTLAYVATIQLRDGNQVVLEHALRFADVATGRDIMRVIMPGAVNALVFAPDGQRVAVNANDGASIWNYRTGKKLQRLDDSEIVYPQLFSPDSKLVFAVVPPNGPRFRLWGLKIWEVATGRCIRTIAGVKENVIAFTLSADGRFIIAEHALGNRANLPWEATVRVWDLAHAKDRGAIVPPPIPKMGNRGAGLHAVGAAGILHWGKGYYGNSPAGDGALFFWSPRRVRVGFASTGSPLVFPDYRPRPDLQNRHGGYSLHHPTTGAELAHFGYGVSRSGALSPDGRTLAIAEFTGGKPKSKLRLWDVSPLLKNSKPDHMQNDQLLKTAWNALRSDDTTAHEAMRILAAHPRESLQIFLKHLTPEQIRPKVPQQAEIKQWVHALDSGVFQTRDEATRQLENVGVLARPVLETFLKSGVSLETLRRGNLLLDKLKRVPAPAWELQRLRAIDVLEQVHSPEAMRILKNLADGLTESSVTQAAQASLVRLGHPSTKERK